MKQKAVFAPQLIIGHGVTDINFYTDAFGAKELQRWSNDDGTIHVAALEVEGNLFHLHEIMEQTNNFSPVNVKGTTVIIGLMVDDVHAVFNKAIAAGAKAISPVTDYEYGYRQGNLVDPFGHHWLIQKILV